jgi:hypothetical protein
VTTEHKEIVWNLHRQKAAFANEHDHIKARIFDNENGLVHCRSWLLVGDFRDSTDVSEMDWSSTEASACQDWSSTEASAEASAAADFIFLAAMTVRLNPYIRQSGTAWAQVMNLSVSEERKGHGTCLVAGVEELLRREGVNVVALYPVQNNRATNFWASMGYAEHAESLLPVEELDPQYGSLLPEGYMSQSGEKVVIPRWEKSIIKSSRACAVHAEDESSWKSLKREQWPLWRKSAPRQCRMDNEELLELFKAAQDERDTIKMQHREKDSW